METQYIVLFWFIFFVYAVSKFYKKCNHPAVFLHVEDNETISPSDIEGDMEHVTYHLYCMKCNEKIDIKFARFIGGVDAAIQREKERISKGHSGE